MKWNIDRIIGAIGIVLGLLGVAVGLGVDSKTVGELRVVQGCFLFSALALFAPIVLWAVNSGAHLWKRSGTVLIGAGVIAVYLMQSIGWVNERHKENENSNSTPYSPFLVTPEGGVFANSSAAYSLFWMINTGPIKTFRAPVSALMKFRIVNQQSEAAMISRLTIEAGASMGWVKLARIPSNTVRLFTAGSGGLKNAKEWHTMMLDTMLASRAIGPKETVEGALILCYPRAASDATFTGTYRVTVSDTMGHTSTVDTSKVDAGDLGAMALTPVPDETKDIDGHRLKLLQDMPGFWN